MQAIIFFSTINFHYQQVAVKNQRPLLWARELAKNTSELLWCWVGTGTGIQPWLEETKQNWYPTQPQVPSGSKPENFPVLNHTTWPGAKSSLQWVFFFLEIPHNEQRGMHWMHVTEEIEKERTRGVWVHLRFLICCFHLQKGLIAFSWEQPLPSVSSHSGRLWLHLNSVPSFLFRLEFILHFQKDLMGRVCTPGKYDMQLGKHSPNWAPGLVWNQEREIRNREEKKWNPSFSNINTHTHPYQVLFQETGQAPKSSRPGSTLFSLSEGKGCPNSKDPKGMSRMGQSKSQRDWKVERWKKLRREQPGPEFPRGTCVQQGGVVLFMKYKSLVIYMPTLLSTSRLFLMFNIPAY